MSDTAQTGLVKTSLVGFSAGNIISDAVFTNKSTMSEAQIQSFLNSKVPSCQSGYVCLKDLRTVTQSKPADSYCSGYSGSSNESGAGIIYRVAQACNINPQVLLVMLQKEQGLVTHTWPSDWRYNAAMGQACPDTAPCDTAFAGFFAQVYGAARQMQIYLEGRWFQWYKAGQTWQIQYHPDRDRCGTGPVYIENKATEALYYYTPYQPNASALAAGYGEGDSCGSYGNRNFYNYFTDWFGSTHAGEVNHSPVGFIDRVVSRPGAIDVEGWTLDPDTSDSIDVHVYVGAVGYPATANQPRPDLAPHYPGLGTNHGFRVTVPATTNGDVRVCIYGINRALGENRLIGCSEVRSLGGSPVGDVNSVQVGKGELTVTGWALDPDTVDPIDVHVYVDGIGRKTTADHSRPDVAAAYPLYGTNHGYSITVPSSGGPRTVCAYGINVKSGDNALLAPCRQVFVEAAADPGTAPIGRLDEVSVVGAKATLRGWAMDPDTATSTEVHVYVNGLGAAYRADLGRPDIAAAFPGYGSAHGFDVKLDLPSAGARVCVYAINSGVGPHLLLGCRQLAPENAPPIGNFESAILVDGGVRVTGWALDPDTAEPIAVHAYVDGVGYPYSADQVRVDVGQAYPQAGANHGFSVVVPHAGGPSTVCLYAINASPGDNPLLGCRVF